MDDALAFAVERAAYQRRLREKNEEIDRLRAALKKINVGEGWAAQIARAALEGSNV